MLLVCSLLILSIQVTQVYISWLNTSNALIRQLVGVDRQHIAPGHQCKLVTLWKNCYHLYFKCSCRSQSKLIRWCSMIQSGTFRWRSTRYSLEDSNQIKWCQFPLTCWLAISQIKGNNRQITKSITETIMISITTKKFAWEFSMKDMESNQCVL